MTGKMPSDPAGRAEDFARRHAEDLELNAAPKTKLTITDGARRILRALARVAGEEPEPAFCPLPSGQTAKSVNTPKKSSHFLSLSSIRGCGKKIGEL